MHLPRVELNSVVQEVDNLCFLKILWFGRLGRLGFGIITTLQSTIWPLEFIIDAACEKINC